MRVKIADRPEKDINITEDDILGRTKIGIEYSILPRYIYLPEGMDVAGGEEVMPRYLLDEVRKSSNFIELRRLLEEPIEKLHLDEKADILRPFVVYNKTFEDFKDEQEELETLMTSLADDVKDLFDNDPNKAFRYIMEVWKNREAVDKEFIREIEEAKKVAVENELFSNIEEVEHTDFLVSTINFDILVKTDSSIFDIFNLIELRDSVPFARVNLFYKVLKDFVPKAEWVEVGDKDVIMLMMAQGDVAVLSSMTDDSYVPAKIYKKDEKTMVINMTLKVGDDSITQDEYMSRLFAVFGNMISDYELEESKVSGVVIFPMQDVNLYVYSDLMMNDNAFISQVVSNESRKITKTKKTVSIYYQADDEGNAKVKGSLTNRIASKQDLGISSRLKLNDKYARIKITYAQNRAVADEFIKVASKLFTLYDRSYESVVKDYRRYIPGFGETSDIVVVEPSRKNKQRLKDIAPEIFVGKYTRLCQNIPIIIDDEDVDEYKEKGYEVMKFPREDSGLKVHSYMCTYPDFKYPGLRSNKDNLLVPYVPCCYKTDQMLDNNSKYNNYFKGTEAKTKGVQQDYITTKKYAQYGAYGVLPDNMLKMFEVLDPECNSPDCMYVRRGVYRTKNSFLQCVVDAVSFKRVKDLDNRESRLVKIRKEVLSKNSYASSCKQEMYDYRIDDIISMIANEDIYLDPKLFVHLLEVAYNCRIYIFTREKVGSDGELIVPRHLEGYYREASRKKSVFIFEHYGSESDNAKEPRCELIVRVKKSTGTTSTTFDASESVAKGVNDVFNSLNTFYILNKEVGEIEFPLDMSQVKLQHIDTYGKTRILNIDFEGKIVSLYTSPLQPFKLRSNDLTEAAVFEISPMLVNRFVKSIGMNVSSRSTEKVRGKIGDIDVYVMIKGIDRKNSMESSDLVSYNTNRRLARYLTEFMYWTYSVFISEDKDKTVQDFVDSTIIVDESFVYKDVSNKFENNEGFMVGTKLVVTSQEMLKRLVYALQLEIVRDSKGLSLYKDRMYINNYFENIDDFAVYPNQTLLYGNDAMLRWIGESDVEEVLHDDVNIDYGALLISAETCVKNFSSRPWLTVEIDGQTIKPSIQDTYISFDSSDQDLYQKYVDKDSVQVVRKNSVINLDEDAVFDGRRTWYKTTDQFLKLMCSSQYSQRQVEDVLSMEDLSGKYLTMSVVFKLGGSEERYVVQNEDIFRSQQEYLFLNDSATNEIKKNSESPYFFKNVLVSPNIMLAQNVSTFEEALGVGSIWKTEGHNPRTVSEIESNKDVGYKVFKYIDPERIYLVESYKAYFDYIVILGYKILNNDNFTVLLPL